MKEKRVFEHVDVVSNRRLRDSELMLLSFFSPTIALMAMPGQFVEIGIPEVPLPRPFTIHRVHNFGIVEILYQVVGRGTKILSKIDEGEQITTLGPLGHGFTLQQQRIIYLVGGGTGIAPLKIISDKMSNNNCLAFVGARTKTLLPGFDQLPSNTKISTDDGTQGFKGTVLELMSKELLSPAPILACGPKPMLKALWNLVKDWKTNVQFSLEGYMACGVGACLGCAIKTKNGNKKICLDGPVFDALEVVDGL